MKLYMKHNLFVYPHRSVNIRLSQVTTVHFITSSRYQRNQFRVRKAGRTHLRVPKSPEGGRPCRPFRSLVPVYKRFYCFRSNRTLLNFSNFDLSRSCRNLIPPYLRRRRSPAAWLQYTPLIMRAIDDRPSALVARQLASHSTTDGRQGSHTFRLAIRR